MFKKKQKDILKNEKIAIQFSKSGFTRSKLEDPNLNRNVIRSTSLISRIIASTRLEYLYKDTEGKISRWQTGFMKKLTYAPNSSMSAFDFWQKVVNFGLINNDSFVWLVRNGLDEIVEFIPITSTAERLIVPEGFPDMCFVEFTLKKTGQKLIISEDDLLHFRFRFSVNDYFGDINTPLKETVSINADIWNSVVNWSKNSAALRGVLAANGILKDEDIDKVNQRMKDTFLDPNNSGGFLVVDDKFNFSQITNTGTGIDEKYIEVSKKDIYEYFGVNQKLIEGSARPQELQSFYQITIKPILSMIEGELNRKLISERELGFDHKFLFVGDNLDHMSPNDKNSTVTLLSNLGCLTRNEIREAYGYFPVPGGDVLVYSKNFAEVNEEKDTGQDDDTKTSKQNSQDVEEEQEEKEENVSEEEEQDVKE